MSDFTKLHRLERVAALNGASTKARAVWSLCHHALDRRGRMELGGGDYPAVLVRRLGVDTSERQWFYAGLRELEKLGLASVHGDVFVLGGHAGATRADQALTDLRPTSSRPVADLHPTSAGPSTDLPPILHPTSSRPSTDLLPGSSGNHSDHVPRVRDQNREEENRIEVEERPAHTVEHSHVVELFSRLRAEAHQRKHGRPGGKYNRTVRDWQPVEDLVAFGRANGLDALEDSLRGFLGDSWAVDAGWPISTWAKDPGRYMGRLGAATGMSEIELAEAELSRLAQAKLDAIGGDPDTESRLEREHRAAQDRVRAARRALSATRGAA